MSLAELIEPMPLADVQRPRKGWTEEEVKRARAWREQVPPLPYAEIGRRMGGRSDQSVRIKLYEERSRETRRYTPTRGFTRAQREEWGPEPGPMRDHALVAACRRTGGFTAFSYVQPDPIYRPRVKVIARPMIGGDGTARPDGWRDGAEPEAMTPDQQAHLLALKRHWREADRKAVKLGGRGE